MTLLSQAIYIISYDHTVWTKLNVTLWKIIRYNLLISSKSMLYNILHIAANNLQWHSRNHWWTTRYVAVERTVEGAQLYFERIIVSLLFNHTGEKKIGNLTEFACRSSSKTSYATVAIYCNIVIVIRWLFFALLLIFNTNARNTSGIEPRRTSRSSI